MSKRGDHAMLVTDSFDLHMLMAQYLLAVKSNKLLYLRRVSGTALPLLCTVAVII